MIVAVAGGKGGVGKTLVSTSLARTAAPVWFGDCDVEEPNAHIFLKFTPRRSDRVDIQIPTWRKWKGEACQAGADFCRYGALAVVNDEMLVFPSLCTACGGCFLLCPQQSLRPAAHQVGTVRVGSGRDGIECVMGELKVGEQRTVEVIRAVKERLSSSADTIIDCPPGNGRPALEALRGSDFCLLVTEPTPFGLEDLRGNVELARLLDIPIGVIVNRSADVYRGVSEWCGAEKIPLLLEIPFEIGIARSAARGQTLQENAPSWTPRLRELWEDIRKTS